MNSQQLNIIAYSTFKNIEADAIIVLHSTGNGITEVIPFWEHSYEFTNAVDMYADVENKLVKELITFADETSAGDSIGTYVCEYIPTDELPIEVLPFEDMPEDLKAKVVKLIAEDKLSK